MPLCRSNYMVNDELQTVCVCVATENFTVWDENAMRETNKCRALEMPKRRPWNNEERNKPKI